jgi:copper chaperone CopZ
VQPTSTYVHALKGRLRIKVSGMKGSPAKALEIEGQLRALAGVNHVKANPTTGNVLILYYPDRIGQQEVIGALQRLGCLHAYSTSPVMVADRSPVLRGVADSLVETLVRSTVELALQRLVTALI